jgi:Golgi phosphoprotein 3 (GPP34)
VTGQANGRPRPRLGGTGRVADELYLIAHRELTGRAHLAPRAVGLGLAGGLLAELVLVGAICKLQRQSWRKDQDASKAEPGRMYAQCSPR